MSHVPSPDATMSTTEAGRLIGVSRTAVARWARAGRLRSVRVGHDYRVRRADVLAFRDEATAGHGPECKRYTNPFGVGIECDCVACHCGPLSDPTGPLGSCTRCHRPVVVDGRVVR